MSRSIVNVMLETADLKLLKEVLDDRLEEDGRAVMDISAGIYKRFGIADRERAAGVCALLEAHIKAAEPPKEDS